MAPRGKLFDRNWKCVVENATNINGISVFVIPILAYKKDYAEWKEKIARNSSQHSNHHGLNQSGDDLEIDPAEEVTVNDVNLAIKDEEDEAEEGGADDDHDDEDDEDEAQK